MIGNPPYISAPNQIKSPILNEQRTRIVKCKCYKTLNEKWDIYIPFMELGVNLLCNNGVSAMIVPYPVTNQKYGKKLRQMFTDECQLLEIADLNGTKIFDNATVCNCITFVRKTPPTHLLNISHISDKKVISVVLKKLPAELSQNDGTQVWNLTDEERTNEQYASMNVLGDFCYISKGMVVNAHENIAKGAFKKEDLISEECDDIHPRKYIEAKDIDKYQIKKIRYLEWDTERCPNLLSRPTFRELYDCPKLIMNCLGSINATLDCSKHFVHNHSIYCAVLWKDLREVNNKSISSSIKKFSKYERPTLERKSNQVSLLYLLGIINSSKMDQLLADQRGCDYHIYPEHIRNIPIPVPTTEKQTNIANLVKQILEKKTRQEDVSAIIQELDDLVEHLYE